MIKKKIITFYNLLVGGNMKNILLYFSIKYQGDWEKIFKAIEQNEQVEPLLFNEIKNKYRNTFITILDSKYPNNLKSISKPPFVIFFKGNLELLRKRAIWVFGISDIKISQIKINKLIIETRDNNVVIVNGEDNQFEKMINNKLNKDKYSNQIIVKNSGIDHFSKDSKILEEVVKNNGLIISEYPNIVFPSKEKWLDSNRIKTGLTKSMLLFNSLKNEFVFSILRNHIKENRDIYCLEEKNPNSLNHNPILIKNGAISVKSILEIA